ncbi:hypothetical protein L6164_032368 [Bauhinia variegata]|uniref:Uncharacterized protein n=1 Tax=Bauhinia variegata TaxID=167791 RepID=A0ACB9KNM5_BAUVA|nr:hypothetical protein L6164_032368 [Bauhinia variegata]
MGGSVGMGLFSLCCERGQECSLSLSHALTLLSSLYISLQALCRRCSESPSPAEIAPSGFSYKKPYTGVV